MAIAYRENGHVDHYPHNDFDGPCTGPCCEPQEVSRMVMQTEQRHGATVVSTRYEYRRTRLIKARSRPRRRRATPTRRLRGDRQANSWDRRRDGRILFITRGHRSFVPHARRWPPTISRTSTRTFAASGACRTCSARRRRLNETCLSSTNLRAPRGEGSLRARRRCGNGDSTGR